MELLRKHILGVLEKPLDLVTKFIASLVGESSSGSRGGHYSPSPSTHSPITSNPLVPAFLVLTVGLLLVTVTPIGPWLAAQGSPTLNEIFSFSRKKQSQGLPKAAEAVSVWTKKQAGFYYCEGGTLFGNKPGHLMTQTEALTSGFRPAGGKYCTNNHPVEASSDDSYVGNQPPTSGVSLTNAIETASQPTKIRSRQSMTIASGKVWAMKVFGTYYCQSDALFGSMPGKLMTEAEALKSGYQPSNARCTNENANSGKAANQAMGSQRPGASQGNSMVANDASAPISKEKDGELSKASESVRVWVIKELGFYYCQGDVLFGHRPGGLMTQSDALVAGYQPSDDRCTNGTPKQPSGGKLTSQMMHGAR